MVTHAFAKEVGVHLQELRSHQNRSHALLVQGKLAFIDGCHQSSNDCLWQVEFKYEVRTPPRAASFSKQVVQVLRRRREHDRVALRPFVIPRLVADGLDGHVEQLLVLPERADALEHLAVVKVAALIPTPQCKEHARALPTAARVLQEPVLPYQILPSSSSAESSLNRSCTSCVESAANVRVEEPTEVATLLSRLPGTRTALVRTALTGVAIKLRSPWQRAALTGQVGRRLHHPTRVCQGWPSSPTHKTRVCGAARRAGLPASGAARRRARRLAAAGAGARGTGAE
eukprot:scaffold1146_cov399-Prasinococcus_capsulatus_cf.AAC.85